MRSENLFTSNLKYNLYPFQEVISKEHTYDQAIENIDISEVATNSNFDSSPEYKLQGLMGRGPGNTEKLKFMVYTFYLHRS